MGALQSAYELGKAYIEQNKLDLAVAEFKKAINSENNNTQIYLELGKAYYLQNEFILAIETLKRGLSLNSEDYHLRLLLAKSYQGIGGHDLAKDEFKAVSEIPATEYAIHVELSEFFRNAKMYDFAILEYEKLLPQGLGNDRIADLLQLYNFNGEYSKAKRLSSSLLHDHSWQETYWKNRLLNELEIAERRTVLNSKPRILLVTLTNCCNLNCYMCGRGDSEWEISPVIAEQIVAALPYLDLITWQGGEVFLAKRFSEMFEKTFGNPYLKQIIITNALLINKDWAERIAERNHVGLTISIDSVDKKTYEFIRRGASFERLTENLELINRAKRKYSSLMTLTLRCTIMKANHQELERFIEFAKDYGFDVVQMAPLSSDGFDPQNIFINKDMEVLKFIASQGPKIRELARKYGIKLLDWIPELPQEDIPAKEVNQGYRGAEVKLNNTKKPVCFRPWKQIAMNVKGDIFPECLCSEPIGDAFRNTLEEVWNNEKMQEYRRMLSGNDFTKWCRTDCSLGTIPAEHLKFTFV